MPTGEDDLERYLIGRIEEIRQRYEEVARPYFEELMRLQALKPPRPVILTMLEIERSGISIPDFLKDQNA